MLNYVLFGFGTRPLEIVGIIFVLLVCMARLQHLL